MAAAAAAKNARLQVERLCHAAFDARKAVPSQLRGCDLDGERNAIEIGANPLDDGKIVRRWLKTPIAEPAAFFEQARGHGLPGAIGALQAGIERGDLVQRLALDPERAPAGVDQE